MIVRFTIGAIIGDKLKMLLWSACFFIAVSSSGQTQIKRFVAKNVELNKANRESQELINKLESAFTDYEIYNIDVKALNSHLSTSGVRSEFILEVDGESLRLDLEEVDLRSENYVFRAITENGIEILPKSEIKTYKGFVNDDVERTARLLVKDDYLAGVINKANNKLIIEPASRYASNADRSSFVTYYPADVKSNGNLTCGYKGSSFEYTLDIAEKKEVFVNAPCKVVEIAQAADYSMLQLFGSNGNIELEVLNALNIVSDLYSDPNLNLTYKMTELIVEATDANTFNTKDPDGNNTFAAFNSWIKAGGFSNDYAVTTLWTTRDMTAGFAINGYVLDPIPNVCNDKNLLAGGPNSLVKWAYPASFGDAILQAHELGHNWGSSHDSGCGDCVMRNGPNPGTHAWSNFEYNNVANGVANAPCLKSCDTQPASEFTAGATCGGNVSFINRSSGASAFEWNFGDGSTSSERNPTHTYSAAGNYTVSLKAKMGSSEDIKQLSIQVSGNVTDQLKNVGMTLTGGALQTTIERVMYFDVKKPMVIKSVTTNLNQSGYVTVEIYDKNASLIFRKRLNVNTGTNKLQLNAELPIGNNYYMAFGQLSIGMNVYRSNSGVSFPYSNDLVSITKSNANSNPTGFYYYFYDWEVQQLSCTPVPPGTSVSTEEISGSLLNVYPNPGTGLFTIDLNNLKKYAIIELYSSTGQLIYRNGIENTDKYNLDISNQSNGIYLLKVNCNNKESVIKIAKF